MNPEMINAYVWLLVGLATKTTAATMTADTVELNNRAEALGLPESINHAPTRTRYVSLVWDWVDDGPFNLMVALEVT